MELAYIEGKKFDKIDFKENPLTKGEYENCHLSFSFENCTLNHSSFFKTKIIKTTFKDVQLQEVDFTEADLTNSVFDNCDLTGATFDNTIIEKADFSTSYGYSIDPEINRIKKAKFSIHGIAGLLEKYDLKISNTI